MPKRFWITSRTASRVQSAKGNFNWSGHRSMTRCTTVAACQPARREPPFGPRLRALNAAQPPRLTAAVQL